jgi:hippurate hydrolase
MDAIFGMHNWPDLPAGQFAVHSGPVFASGNKFAVTVGGRGGHAAMPHKTVDPIPAACQLVTALQSVVARNVDPLEGAVVSVTNIHGGEAVNVIPNSCEIKGTVRTFSIQALDLIEQRIETISRGLCDSFGASCEFAFDRYYPPTINHTDESDFVRTTLASNGYDCAPAEFPPTFCSEDFGYYLLEKPGCYFLIGNGQGNSIERDGMGSLHSANYDFNDKIIGVGGAAWVKLCEVWFDRINQVDSAGT